MVIIMGSRYSIFSPMVCTDIFYWCKSNVWFQAVDMAGHKNYVLRGGSVPVTEYYNEIHCMYSSDNVGNAKLTC